MKIASIVGARPQFIKIAPLCIEFCKKENINHLIIHTGQHYDYEMSQVFFEDLGLKAPDYHLGVGSGTHGYQTGEMLKLIEDVLLEEKPDLVMVYGDTNSTLAGALAAAKLHIPIAHVEAGLRSFNRRMPEEINRVLTDHVSTFLFCPTGTAVENLRREGFTNVLNAGHLLANPSPLCSLSSVPVVANVGDVMYDAVLLYGDLAEKKSRILKELRLSPKDYALATVHRAENTDDPERLRGILNGLEVVAQKGLPVVFPIHPRTRKLAEAFGLRISGVQVITPVSYLDMIVLEKNARVILTDSGGVQKEAFIFRVPCVTLREETEWVETVEAGWNVLVGCDPRQVARTVLEIRPSTESVSPYGDGRAVEKIVTLFVDNDLPWMNEQLWD